MAGNIIVMPGSERIDLPELETVANEFGWTVTFAHDLHDATRASWNTSAVLFHRSAFAPDCSWIKALQLVKHAVPAAKPVACHGFSDSIDWPQLSMAGLFHALWVPLRKAEVRQTFGFVSEAENRLASSAAALLQSPGIREWRSADRLELPERRIHILPRVRAAS